LVFLLSHTAMRGPMNIKFIIDHRIVSNELTACVNLVQHIWLWQLLEPDAMSSLQPEYPTTPPLMAQHPLVSRVLQIIEVFTRTLRHTTLFRTPLDGWSTQPEICSWQHTTLTTDIRACMPLAGFEPVIPASERPQTHTLNRVATVMGRMSHILYNRSCVVCLARRLRGARSGARIAVGAKGFLFSKTSVSTLAPTQPSLQGVPAFFPGGEATGT